jgi:hypothetical protein
MGDYEKSPVVHCATDNGDQLFRLQNLLSTKFDNI